MVGIWVPITIRATTLVSLYTPTAPGKVSKVIETCSWGRIVLVRHETSFGVYTSMYAHVNWLGSGPPTLGADVTPSNKIATIGNGASANCSTPIYPYHLHFEIRRGDSVLDFRSYPQGYGYWPAPQSSPQSSPCNGSDSISNNCSQHQVDPNAFIAAHN